MTRYRTIVADPPWDYKPKRGAHAYAKRKGEGVTGGVAERVLPYAAMSVADVAALPVASMGDSRGARVFLWTTNTHLPDAFTVLAGWGFRYSQTLVWHKTNASPFTGSVAFGSAEFLLVGVNGSVPVIQKATSSVLSLGHHHNHSQKPEAFLDLIEAASPGPYLEMFARRNRLGWDTWGNEALEHVEMGA